LVKRVYSGKMTVNDFVQVERLYDFALDKISEEDIKLAFGDIDERINKEGFCQFLRYILSKKDNEIIKDRRRVAENSSSAAKIVYNLLIGFSSFQSDLPERVGYIFDEETASVDKTKFKFYDNKEGFFIPKALLYQKFDRGQANARLLQASRSGDRNEVRRLITNNLADIEAKNFKYGNTPLHLVAIGRSRSRVKTVKYLVEKAKVNVEVKNIDEYTPLNLAARNGCLKNVKYLVEEAGADIEAKNIRGESPLYSAVKRGYLEVVKYLVEEAGANIETKNIHGDSSLHLAIERGHLEVVKYLVEEAGADIEAKNIKGSTLLHYLAAYGCLAAVKYFVEAGADIEAKNISRCTPLHLAALNGRFAVVEYLVKEAGANVEAKNRPGHSPLYLAVNKGEFKVIKYLVEEAGADLEAKNNHRRTALHLAAKNGHLEIVEYLVEEAGANIEAKGFGGSPLSLAIKKNKLEVAEYLVEQGADIPVRTVLRVFNEGSGIRDISDYRYERIMKQCRRMETAEEIKYITSNKAFKEAKKRKNRLIESIVKSLLDKNSVAQTIFATKMRNESSQKERERIIDNIVSREYKNLGKLEERLQELEMRKKGVKEMVKGIFLKLVK